MWKRARDSFLAAIILSGPLIGQVMVSGEVTGQSEEPVKLAKVKIEPTNPAMAKETKTDEKGTFSISFDLTEGNYFLSVNAVDFQPINQEILHLVTGLNRITVKLIPVEHQSINVSPEKEQITLERMELSQTLDEKEIDAIPVTRSSQIKNVIAALPGITLDSRGNPHPYGSPSDQINWLFDGFRANDVNSGLLEMKLSAEAPKSVDLFSSRYSVEYGRGAVAMMLNSGTGDNVFKHQVTDFFPGFETIDGLSLTSWDPRLTLSGPIIKDRVWFFNALDVYYHVNVVRELKDNNKVPIWDASNLSRIQANLTPTNVLSINFLANYFNAPKTGLSMLAPLETTVDKRARRYFPSIQDQMFTHSGAVITFGYAWYNAFAREVPQGHDILRLNPNHWSGNYPHNIQNYGNRHQGFANAILPTLNYHGQHQFKTGMDFNRSEIYQNATRTGYEHFRLDGTPTDLVIFGGNGKFGRSNLESAFYFQDRWTVKPWIVVEGGVRYDKDFVIPGGALTPRISVALMPPLLKGTKFSVGYGLVPALTNLGMFTRKLDQYSINTRFDSHGQQIGDSGLTIFVSDESKTKIPKVSNFSLGMERDLPGNFYIRVNYLRKRSTNDFTFVSTYDRALVPNMSIYPIQNIAIIYNLNNSGIGVVDAVEFSVIKKFSKPLLKDVRQDILSFNYVRSRSFSNFNLNPYIDDPLTYTDTAGRTPWDIPNRFIGYGITRLTKNNSVSYFVEWRDGFPYTVTDDEGRQHGAFNSWRMPRAFSLNISFERKLTLFSRDWAIRLGVDNITNRPNYSMVNSNMSAQPFPNYYGIQPRKFVVRIRLLK